MALGDLSAYYRDQGTAAALNAQGNYSRDIGAGDLDRAQASNLLNQFSPANMALSANAGSDRIRALAERTNSQANTMSASGTLARDTALAGESTQAGLGDQLRNQLTTALVSHPAFAGQDQFQNDSTLAFAKGGMLPAKAKKAAIKELGPDKIPALLAPKEAVLNRHAADILGRGAIETLNNMGLMIAAVRAHHGLHDSDYMAAQAAQDPKKFAGGTVEADGSGNVSKGGSSGSVSKGGSSGNVSGGGESGVMENGGVSGTITDGQGRPVAYGYAAGTVEVPHTLSLLQSIIAAASAYPGPATHDADFINVSQAQNPKHFADGTPMVGPTNAAAYNANVADHADDAALVAHPVGMGGGLMDQVGGWWNAHAPAVNQAASSLAHTINNWVGNPQAQTPAMPQGVPSVATPAQIAKWGAKAPGQGFAGGSKNVTAKGPKGVKPPATNVGSVDDGGSAQPAGAAQYSPTLPYQTMAAGVHTVFPIEAYAPGATGRASGAGMAGFTGKPTKANAKRGAEGTPRRTMQMPTTSQA